MEYCCKIFIRVEFDWFALSLSSSTLNHNLVEVVKVEKYNAKISDGFKIVKHQYSTYLQTTMSKYHKYGIFHRQMQD